VRTFTEAGWHSRLLAASAALAWQVLIFVALLSSARPGVPLVWKPDAHSAVPLPQQALIQYVAILPSSSATAQPKRQLSGPASVPKPAARPLKLADSQTEDAHATRTALNAAVSPTPAVAGDLRIRCEVHIHQDSRGQVQAIDFGACSGDEHWQHNLLDVLQQAAALIRPREGAGVAPVKTMIFDTDAISPAMLATQLMERVSSSAVD
jgi:hypothetical protein